jgi:hypothetical protein
MSLPKNVGHEGDVRSHRRSNNSLRGSNISFWNANAGVLGGTTPKADEDVGVPEITESAFDSH